MQARQAPLPGMLRLAKGIGSPGRERTLPSADVADVVAAIGMQAGAIPYYDVVVRQKDGKKLTAGSSVRDKHEAEWLAVTIKQALGLPTGTWVRFISPAERDCRTRRSFPCSGTRRGRSRNNSHPWGAAPTGPPLRSPCHCPPLPRACMRQRGRRPPGPTRSALDGHARDVSLPGLHLRYRHEPWFGSAPSGRPPSRPLPEHRILRPALGVWKSYRSSESPPIEHLD
jgi:hypothetical protein